MATGQADATVGDIGEFGLIDRIASIVGLNGVVGIGDDAAVIDLPGEEYLLATVDMMIEGVHWQAGAADPLALGRHLVAINVSDIAAMGGSPTFALTSLALPPDTSVTLVERIYQGIKDEAQKYGVGIIGGNLTGTSGPIVLDLMLLGRVAKGAEVRRSGARPGDLLVVTGTLGNASACRLMADAGQSLQQSVVPEPRLTAGQALARERLVHAMIDLSDGLASDLHHLAQASGVGAVIEETALPIAIQARRAALELGIDPTLLALSGGEDYELLCALAEDALPAARQAAGDVPLAVIGTVLHPEHGVLIEHAGGVRAPLEPTGWRHF